MNSDEAVGASSHRHRFHLEGPLRRRFRAGARLFGISGLAVLMSLSLIGDYLLLRSDVLCRAPGARGCVALTFDDGPDPRYTPLILDALAEHDAKATFFVVGEHVERYPELVERMIAEGHEVAHHSQRHPHMLTLTAEELAFELDAPLAALSKHDVTPRWYRPPRKELCFDQKRLARQRGMRVALWTHVMERPAFTSPEHVARILVSEARDGDVLLGHDGLSDRSMTAEAVPLVLAGLKERGLTPVTLSDLHDRHVAHADEGAGEPKRDRRTASLDPM